MSAKWCWAVAVALALSFWMSVPKAQGQSPVANPPTTQPSGVVVVYVVDANNRPVAGATVRLFAAPQRRTGQAAGSAIPALAAPEDDAGGLYKSHPRRRPQPVAQGQTDARGELTLAGIRFGTYVMWAQKTGFGRGRARVTLDPANAGSPVSVTITLRL